MQTLPKGYYAVVADYENAPKDSFTYKGVTFAVTEGENLFASLAEANAHSTEIPDTVPDGLPYESFSTPVILFSAGTHSVDKFVFDRPITILGEGAGIDPNVPGEQVTDLPAENPLRALERESLLKGSYWFGHWSVSDNAVESITVDGFSVVALSFFDHRCKGEGKNKISFRNMIHRDRCRRNCYAFGAISEYSALFREVEFSHFRVQDFDDYDYGTIFFQVSAHRAVFDHIVYDNAFPVVGFTNFARTYQTVPRNTDRAQFLLTNSFFSRMTSNYGVHTSARDTGGRVLDFTVRDTIFKDATPENLAPLQPYLPNDESKLVVSGCRFIDTRGNTGAAISVSGFGKNVTISDSTFEGFAKEVSYRPMLCTDVPETVENHVESWVTQTADPHTVVGTNAWDFSSSDARYSGMSAYYGDQHVHTACGGTSDGKFPMSGWVAAMDEKGLDFAIVVDHRQMRGFFLPEWSEERFVIGTEPGTSILDLNAVRLGQRDIHYNMLFPHKYGLAMVLANFPEFEFRGDELTGSFKYPKFTKSRFSELTAYVQSIGGMMVHPHPKTMLTSADPLDYYIGEHTYLETIYGATTTEATFKNYDLWVKLLSLGKRIYASGGSDTHGNVSNAAVSTFYTSERSGKAFFDRMHEADYTVGGVGMQMCIDGHPMGSELAYEEGMKLTLRINDFFEPTYRENAVFELRIVTDRGVAYSSRFRGKASQAVELEVQKRSFYRAEIFDLHNEIWVAHGNPIWLD